MRTDGQDTAPEDTERLLRAAEAALGAGSLPLRRWVHALGRDRPSPPPGSGLTIDASFSLRGDAMPSARCSVNDRGASGPFRAALVALAPQLGLRDSDLAGFLDLAPPGSVQTTLGLKWRSPGIPSRLTLYFEELSMAPDRGASIVLALADRMGLSGGANARGVQPSAAALDYRPGAAGPVALKLYEPAVDHPGRPGAPTLPGSIEAFRRRLPFHRDRGTRRLLIARRLVSGGTLSGRKLLWVPEVRHSGDAIAAWDAVGELRAALRLPPSAPAAALDGLRSDAAMYPDLVSLDTDAGGNPEGLTVYVATRPA